MREAAIITTMLVKVKADQLLNIRFLFGDLVSLFRKKLASAKRAVIVAPQLKKYRFALEISPYRPVAVTLLLGFIKEGSRAAHNPTVITALKVAKPT